MNGAGLFSVVYRDKTRTDEHKLLATQEVPYRYEELYLP